MNDIVIYDNENNEVARFNTENLVGGTGFMTSDGRFVTARRVVEPWYYYRGTVLGRIRKVTDGHSMMYRYAQFMALRLPPIIRPILRPD